MLEEAYGKSSLYPGFRTKREVARPLIQPGLGEPGVRRYLAKNSRVNGSVSGFRGERQLLIAFCFMRLLDI